jgi:hypothetical protein
MDARAGRPALTPGIGGSLQRRLDLTGNPGRWTPGRVLAVKGLGLLVLAAHSLAAIAVWLGICALQAYRAVREEQLLLAVLPGYGAYRIRTAALLPGIF